MAPETQTIAPIGFDAESTVGALGGEETPPERVYNYPRSDRRQNRAARVNGFNGLYRVAPGELPMPVTLNREHRRAMERAAARFLRKLSGPEEFDNEEVAKEWEDFDASVLSGPVRADEGAAEVVGGVDLSGVPNADARGADAVE